MSPFKVFSDTSGRLTDSVEPVAEFDAGLLQATSSIGIKNKESFDFFIFQIIPGIGWLHWCYLPNRLLRSLRLDPGSKGRKWSGS